MKSTSRRSLLQIRILRRLHQQQAKTITVLAEAINAQRPSVSRSLKALRNDNLVERNRNGWALSAAGEQEAKRRNQQLSSNFKRLAKLANASSLNIAPLASSLLDLRKSLDLNAGMDHLFDLRKSLDLNTSIFAGLPKAEHLTFGHFPGTLSTALHTPSLTSLAQLSNDISAMPTLNMLSAPARDLLGPHLAEALPKSDLFLPRPPESTALVSPTVSRDSNRKETLNQMLASLDPIFVRKRDGSWQALKGSNPDGPSQASSSYRELLRMVLDTLAPDVKADNSQQASKRKLQIHQILPGRERAFAQVIGDGLQELYALLSKHIHSHSRDRLAVEAALTIGDGLLLLLLSKATPPDSHSPR